MRTIKFRAWDKRNEKMLGHTYLEHHRTGFRLFDKEDWGGEFDFMQFIGLTDKNGKDIYEGDIVGEEGVYHFIDREGWKPSSGKWKIIGEKIKNFTGKEEERYIAGYELKVVEWKEKSCGFEPFSDSEENCFHCGGGRNPKVFEVIGNIYENPELINQS